MKTGLEMKEPINWMVALKMIWVGVRVCVLWGGVDDRSKAVVKMMNCMGKKETINYQVLKVLICSTVIKVKTS